MITKFKDTAIYLDENGDYVACLPSEKLNTYTEVDYLEFYNENCRGMYCQVRMTSYGNPYFVLPFKDEAQNYDEDYKYDVEIFGMLDIHTASDSDIIGKYPPVYFFSQLLWDFILDSDLIDTKATNIVINRIYATYSSKNEETYIKDLTIDELKNFRTWLATKLYDGYGEEHETDDDRHAPLIETLNSDVTDMMLKYYKSNMNDDVIMAITKLGESGVIMNDYLAMLNKYGVMSTVKTGSTVTTMGSVIGSKGQNTMMIPGTMSSCGCNGSSLSMYNTAGLGTCDCIAIYRKNVYAQMVSDFSKIDFWTDRTQILADFYKYIEGIINNNFPLGTSEHSTFYCDCTCNSADNQQEKNMNILRNLLKSIGYMIDDEIDGHKNFISESLNKWAVILYEKMQWK